MRAQSVRILGSLALLAALLLSAWPAAGQGPLPDAGTALFLQQRTRGFDPPPHYQGAATEAHPEGGSAPNGLIEWKTETVDTTAGEYPVIAVDAAGHPHIVYSDSAGQLYYAYHDGSAWHTETIGTVDSDSRFANYSLALDPAGRPHIAVGSRDTSSWEHILKYMHFDGVAWQSETVVAAQVTYPALALDAASQAHIGYVDSGGLKYAHWDGAYWQVQAVDDGEYRSFTSLAVDSAGRPRITYCEWASTNPLKYARWTGVIWQVETVPVDWGPCEQTSLLLDAADRPHVGFGWEQYAYWDGSTWQIVQDLGPGVSSGVSLDLDSAGNPHMAFYSWDPSEPGPMDWVVYKPYNGTFWHRFRLGEGQSVALALDPWGNPHLAFDGNGVLRYSEVAASIADWSRLTFASFRDLKDWEVCFALGDGGYPACLTTNNVVDSCPELNRGATHIAFHSNRNRNYDVYRMDTGGASQTRLTKGTFDEGRPTWSPDGSKIAYEAYPISDDDGEIYVMNADGTGQVRLTVDPAWDGHPTWSPDGSKIAFVSRRSGAYELWVMNADGSGQQQLTYGLQNAAYPDWSPDGTRFVLNDDFNGDGWLDVALVNADGTNLTHPLGASPEKKDRLAPVWSPHGQDVAYAYISYVLYQGQWYWEYAYITGSSLEPVASYTLSDSEYDWWPDWQPSEAWPPETQVGGLPPWSGGSFTVSWSGWDPGESGLVSYDVQFRDGAGPWTDWLLNTAETSALFTAGQDGHTYYFRCRGRDYVYNVEPYPESPDAWTSVDGTPPQTSASSPRYVNTTAFAVSWGGYDAASGIASYDVQYRDGAGGSWTDLIAGTALTTTTFNGQANHTYYFQSRARDIAGNVEPYPGGDGDTITLVDQVPPASAASSPENAAAPTFLVTWSGTDSGAGLDSYDVQYRDGEGGPWTTWLADTATTQMLFPGGMAHTYYFRCRARDLVGNEEPYPASPDTHTHTPPSAVAGYVLGNREQAVALALVEATPPLSNTAWTGPDGAFTLYAHAMGTVALRVTRAGFGSLPAMVGVSVPASVQPTFYLPPLDDRIVDGGFEAGNLAAWGSSGTLLPTLAGAAHTGAYAAQLGGAVPPAVVTPTTPFTASAVLTRSGGLLTATLVAMAVPSGTVSGTVVFTLTTATAAGLPAGVQDVGPHLDWAAALTDGTPLTTTLRPVTLTVSYQDAAWQAAQVAGEETLQLWWQAPAGGTWVPLSGTIDVLSNTVTVTATRPGRFALLGAPFIGPWSSALSQEVALPSAIPSATLSLLYHVAGGSTPSDTLVLRLAGAGGTISYTLPLTGSGWVHRWWALPAWAGPTLTVRLEWAQGEREAAGVVLDEVSLGAAEVGGYGVYLPLVPR